MVGKWFDDDGRIVAYAEYCIVDIKGNYTLYGDYCFIFDVWVHDDYRRKEMLRQLLMQERNKYPNVTYIYWTRGKYKNRMAKYEIRRIIHGWGRRTTAATSTSIRTSSAISV